MLIEYIGDKPKKEIMAYRRRYIFAPNPQYEGRKVAEVEDEDVRRLLAYPNVFRPYFPTKTGRPRRRLPKVPEAPWELRRLARQLGVRAPRGVSRRILEAMVIDRIVKAQMEAEEA